jgi:hypothetical protein
MAVLIAYQDGNITGSTTFKGIVTSTGAEQNVGTSTTNSTTSYVWSSQFTITNAVVVEGFVLYLRRNTASPTGTLTVALSEDGGTTATREVTINVSDLPNNTSNLTTVFFKFGSTLTGDGGTDYVVGIKTSVSGEVTVGRNATAGNWFRVLRTNTTATIALNDTVYINGEWTAAATKTDITVTMNNTSTSRLCSQLYIGVGGTLKYGTSASTAYYLNVNKGPFNYPGGTWNMGTVADPIPRSSSATLELVVASAGADGFTNYGTFTMQGQSRSADKNVVFTTLTADAAANATSLSVAADTGWLSGDTIAVAPTSRTRTEAEVGTLNGNAGASSMNINGFAGTGGGLLNAHGGTSPVVCHVALMTRNVMITGSSSSLSFNFTHAGTGATMDCDWAAFRYLSSASIQGASSNSASFDYFAIQNGTITASSGGGTISWNQCTVYSNTTSNNNFTHSTGGSMTITNMVCILFGSFIMTANLDSGYTVTDLNTAGASGIGINFAGSGAAFTASTMNNLTAYCATTGGILCNNSSGHTATNCKTFRTSGYGVAIQAGTNSITTLTSFGNTNYGLQLAGDAYGSTITDATLAGDTTFAQSVGIYVSTANGVTTTLRNINSGPTSGIYVANTSADVSTAATVYRTRLVFDNCLFGSTTEFIGTNLAGNQTAYITSGRHDQTSGNFKSVWRGGTISADTSIYKTASPSERLTPTLSTLKLLSGTRSAAILSGTTRTVSVWVRESVVGDGTDYNGNRARLICRTNHGAGVTSDQVLATATVSSEGAWQQLSATTPSVTDNAVLEFYVDCDGTTGWVNVDDWRIS